MTSTEATTKPLLEIRDLSKSFGSVQALTDVDFEAVSYTHLTLPTILRV